MIKFDRPRLSWPIRRVYVRAVWGLGLLATFLTGHPVLAQSVPDASAKDTAVTRSFSYASSALDGPSPLERQPPVLTNFVTANMLPKGALLFSVGQHQNFNASFGTGNQTYYREIRWALSDRVELAGFYQTYSDPIPDPVNGATPRLRWSAPGISAKVRLGETGNLSFAVLGSVEYLHLVSALFETAPGTESNLIFGSVQAPVTMDVSPKLQFHVTPAVSVFPSQVGGTDFYGTVVSLGAGVSFQASERLVAYGAVSVPFGPGGNTIASDRSIVNTPIYTLGGRYSLTPKFALNLYMTNGYGLTPGSNILSFIPDGDDPFFGLKLTYAPGRGKGYRPSYRDVIVAPDQRRLQLNFDGFTLGSASVLPVGNVSGTGFYGTSDNLGVSAAFAFERDLQVEGYLEQYAGDGSLPAKFAREFRDTRHGAGRNPRWSGGLKIGLMNTRYGDPFSLAARVSAGRSIPGPGTGILYADLTGTHVFDFGTAVSVSPKLGAIGAGDESIFYGVGLGVNHELFRGVQLIGEVTPMFNATGTVWAAGARYATRDSRFSIDLAATNAIGRNGVGTMLAQDDVKFMLGATVSFGLNPRLSPVGLFGG